MKLMPKAFHVEVVEPILKDAQPDPQPEKQPVDWTRITLLAQDTAKQLVLAGSVAYAAKKAVDVLGEVAIIAAKAKFN